MNNDNGYIDWNGNKYNYILQYIYESQPIRNAYQQMLYRANKAIHGKPWVNLYDKKIESNLEKEHDPVRKARLREICTRVPEGEDFTIAQAVRNRASQMSSGVDTYKYTINDPYMIIDDDTNDLLSAKCMQDYTENKLGNFASVFSRDLSIAGMTAVYVSYDPVHDKNIVSRINPKNVLWDTKYSSNGQERFRGYDMMISWAKLKQMIADNPDEEVNLDIKAPDNSLIRERNDGRKKKDGMGELSIYVDKTAKYHQRKIRSLNGLDIYVEEMNKLACAWPLQGGGSMDWYEFTHDIQDCYSTQYYTSMATTPEARTKTGYQGDDVKLTVIFDMDKKIEYKVINDRFVISANGNAYHRFIDFMVEDKATGDILHKLDMYELDSPIIIQFEYQNDRDVASFPTSPVFDLLDVHDKLCELRAKREHVVDVLGILRVMTDAADAESLASALNLEGIILDDLQGDIANIKFDYDWTPIDSQIAYYEKLIRDYLYGFTEMDAMQMMGDRASAAESGMAQGAIAQGLCIHQNAIMQLYSDIARQCIGNRVTYSPNQEFPIINRGQSSTITIQQMALGAVIDVVPAQSRSIKERQNATTALTLLGTFGKGVNISEEGVAYFTELATMGTAPRQVVRSFIEGRKPSEQEVQVAQLEAQNQANMLAQNAQAYQQNPIPYEVDNVMQNNSPEEVDAIIGKLSQNGTQESISIDELMAGEPSNNTNVNPLDMPMQEGAMTAGLENMSTDMGSMMANPNSLV